MTGFKNIYSIGEIASAHDGNLSEIKNLLDIYSNKGFDFIKLQIFKLDDLINTVDEVNSPLKDIEISKKNWEEIFNYISINKNKFSKTKYIAEPYDSSSLELCKEFDIFDAYKLPTSDLSNINLIEKILKYTKNIFLGTGGSTLKEISKSINFIKVNYPDVKYRLIHGFQAYPTDIKDMDLWKISYLKNTFSCEVGFADHADASSSILRFLPSCMAVSYGANFIEKHITINRSDKKPDYYSSLNPDEVENFFLAISHASELSKDESFYDLSENEKFYRKSMKKFACTINRIEKGEKLSPNTITFKRSIKGEYSLFDIDYLIGKVASKDLPAGHTILKEDIL